MGELLAKTWLFLADSGKIPRIALSVQLVAVYVGLLCVFGKCLDFPLNIEY